MLKKVLMASTVIFLLAGCSDDASSSVQKSEAQKSSKPKNEVAKSEANINKVVEDSEAKEVVASVTLGAVADEVASVVDDAVVVIDTAKLYVACAGCHGVAGEKAALGKSQIIKGWSEEKTMQALKGYQDGSYGGAMKGLMKGQVDGKSDAELEALAKMIAGF
ncbi:MAG: c-type cytochrome [Sulfuricurvum sp.]|jgi:cytochrome c553